ncbi:MAG: SPFH domain-containing protein [Candidatus Omnitrophota bacterium]|nr:SPFH domain-containing protein [Candidatus Omnitrophota bacterium]MDZ4241491.1 SPFH domain-containing protein [Candidatus Omnitrophota bacterium]
MGPKPSSIFKLAPFLIVLLVVGFFPHSAKSTEVGVRVIKWSPIGKRGLDKEYYAPGATYFFPLFINEWYTFDTRLHNIEMTAGRFGNRKERDDLLFKTIDGNDISLDVVISYRIDPKMAPQILERAAVSNYELEEKVIRTVTRSVTRDIFGELKTEDFYVANKRTEKADLVKEALNKTLNPYGVIVESVLPRDYRFNPAYQKAIEEKKIADQMTERFKSEAKATVEEYNQRVQQAQGEVNKLVAEADGEFQKAKISVDAYYEQQAMIAQAIEKEGQAESQGIEKMVEALNSQGGKTMVKIKMAEALQGKRILLLPFGQAGGIDLKTTDVNDLLKVYGVKSLSQ